MKAVVLDRFGEPGEVLQTRDVPLPEPGRGQVRVKMIAAPVNPSDLMVVRGMYGRLPTLPATPGFEGVGVIDAAGPGLARLIPRFKPGKRVAVINPAGGNWAEYAVIPAKQAVPIADGIPDDQAAAFFVNPATVLVMVRYVLRVPAGAWLLQSAAGSALGRMIIRMSKHDGYRTINVVRRREQADELKRLGGTAVICSSEESIEERVKEITGGEMVRFALDCVGGPTGSALVRSLAREGRMLIYGTLSNEPLSIDPRLLLTQSAKVEGFWLTNWTRHQGPLRMLSLFRKINELLKGGVLTSEIGTTFSLEEVGKAVKQAETMGRQGKVLLRMP